ncbi:MAG: biopolymer transporter ExbD [Limisphaerales bacterium]
MLLIIFIITTPLLEQSISLKLPTGGRPDGKIDPRNVRTIEISNTGIYVLDKQRMNLNQIIAKIATDYRSNPNLIVYIRAEKTSPYENVAAVIDGCQRNGITRYSLRTDPTK